LAKLPHPHPPLPAPTGDERITVEKDTLVWRVYGAGGRHPASWDSFRSHGPVRNGRFDHHDPPPHDDPVKGILYGALDGPAAIAEAFGDARMVDRFRDSPWLVAFALEIDMAALDLGGPWSTRAGASQALTSGRRDIAQAWSREIHAGLREIDALLYPSAMSGGSTNVVLYERAQESLPRRPSLHIPLAHPGLEPALNRIALRFGYSMR